MVIKITGRTRDLHKEIARFFGGEVLYTGYSSFPFVRLLGEKAMIDLRIPDHNGSIICILLPNPTENDKKKCWADGSGHTPASFCLEFSEIKTITYGT